MSKPKCIVYPRYKLIIDLTKNNFSAGLKTKYPESCYLTHSLWVDPSRVPGNGFQARQIPTFYSRIFTDSLIKLASEKFKTSAGEVRCRLKNVIIDSKRELMKGVELNDTEFKPLTWLTGLVDFQKISL